MSDLLEAWPQERTLAALCTGIGASSPARLPAWSLVASPKQMITIDHTHADPFGEFQAHIDSTAMSDDRSIGPPFVGGWIVALSYDLGRVSEPAAVEGVPRKRDSVSNSWPWQIVLWRCETALMVRHDAGGAAEWFQVGADAEGELGAILEHVRRAMYKTPRRSAGEKYELQPPTGDSSPEAYASGVARVIEYLRAGDAYQVNLAHQLKARFRGSSRSMFIDLLRKASPWYAGYLEVAALARAGASTSAWQSHAAVCASPELFLEYNAQTREVITRPIKGTRPLAAEARELDESPKDQAELNMIVDLMRNDLGRVAKLGSVRVDSARTIERHAAVQHAVATISARLAPGCSVSELLGATFPGGSITGAPKVRAMQIIDELELEPRGLYTGAIGYISDCGSMALNIAIRTAVIREKSSCTSMGHFDDGEVSFGVGAGIVVDSQPLSEWQESIDKAGVLYGLVNTPAAESPSRTVRPKGVPQQ